MHVPCSACWLICIEADLSAWLCTEGLPGPLGPWEAVGQLADLGRCCRAGRKWLGWVLASSIVDAVQF